jgi:hypothetical protein
VIVSFHVASGAAAGSLLRSRAAAIAAGPLLHLAADLVPHMDISSRRFELWSGGAMLGGLVVLRGPLAPATVGAFAASAPDLEHVLRFPRPGGRKLFPSHRLSGWHRPGGLTTARQLLAAGLLFGFTIAHRSNSSGGSPSTPSSRSTR